MTIWKLRLKMRLEPGTRMLVQAGLDRTGEHDVQIYLVGPILRSLGTFAIVAWNGMLSGLAS